eukprot:m.53855 g.53855  ORF g.53855 m.53855 type:complete len:349 (+) comp10884_c0_seq3:245-1291(+)
MWPFPQAMCIPSYDPPAIHHRQHWGTLAPQPPRSSKGLWTGYADAGPNSFVLDDGIGLAVEPEESMVPSVLTRIHDEDSPATYVSIVDDMRAPIILPEGGADLEEETPFDPIPSPEPDIPRKERKREVVSLSGSDGASHILMDMRSKGPKKSSTNNPLEIPKPKLEPKVLAPIPVPFKSRTSSSSTSSSPEGKYSAKYQCDICGKIFNQSGNLNRHRVVHTRERPFKCQICGKGFSQKSHVRTHQTVHTGLKAFECKYCDKKFSQLGHLNGHLERHRKNNDPIKPNWNGGKKNSAFNNVAIKQDTHLPINTQDLPPHLAPPTTLPAHIAQSASISIGNGRDTQPHKKH